MMWLKRHSTWRQRSAVLTLLAALLLIAACSAAAPEQVGAPIQADSAGRDSSGGTPASGDADGDAAPVPGSDDHQLGGIDASLADRRIVKTGEISVEVPNVAGALAQVRALTDDLGGYVGGSQAGTLDERATLTLRVPSHRFDELLARLHELDGDVKAETTREEDVTGAIVDLEARIENLRASEAQYRLLLERAEKIDDILNVQARLDQVRGEIEQLSAQLKQLSGQADLATLVVTLLPPPPAPVEQQTEGWDPGAIAGEALGALVAVAQGIATALIWIGIVWLPVLLVMAIVTLVLLRGVIEVRRRFPTAVREPAAGDPPPAS